MTGIAAEPAVGTDQAGAHDEAEPFDAEERRVGAAHAGSLKAQAAAGGLRFEIFLPPGLAVWLLDLVEKGLFKDPAEAAFVMLGEQQDLWAYPDLRRDLLRRTVEAAANDPRPAVSAEALFTKLDAMLAAPLPRAAVWDSSVTRPGTGGK